MEDQPLNVWCLEAHRLAAAGGFWQDYEKALVDGLPSLHFLTTPIALLHSEVSELLEARRAPNASCDKPIPLSSEEEECADIFLRLADYCGARNINFGRAVSIKHKYNKTRDWKHGKNF